MSATYTYQAIDAKGGNKSGELTASSRSVALRLITEQGLVPLELREATQNAEQAKARRPSLVIRRLHEQVAPRDLLALTQSLASLLKAGLMVDRALIIAEPLATTAAVRTLVSGLLKSVRGGRTLAMAFTESRQKLPPYYISMIEAGEAGGTLASAMERLADLQQRSLDMKERVRSALIYPTLLMGVMLFTVIVLVTFVLPRFEQLFSESTAPLPWSTQAVLAGGRFFSNWWWLLLILLSVAVVGFLTWKKTVTGRKQLDKWLLHTRITLQLPIALNAARFFQTVSTLLTNGLPLPSALRVARGTVSNHYLSEAVVRVTREVQAGATLSQALANARVFPPAVVQLSRVGEETGQLDQLLFSAARILEEDVKLKLERLLVLVVPLLTITMGLLVAGLIGSVLIGLLSINDLAF